MDDPVPASGSFGPAGPVGDAGVGAALDTVDLVTAWYSRSILAERRSPASDPGRLERLITGYRECVRDRERLEEAPPGEVARVTALYAARLKELDVGGS
ncbi:hypothetical protein [Streptomyces uncialis]|uniref:hypothetical protein n=1 Tax=Streptomyces uncialis TaxID=1048205 RepID=UPI003869D9DC|nr:hypothetical protein OG268_36895 [Streptomyces uncialis]